MTTRPIKISGATTKLVTELLEKHFQERYQAKRCLPSEAVYDVQTTVARRFAEADKALAEWNKAQEVGK